MKAGRAFSILLIVSVSLVLAWIFLIGRIIYCSGIDDSQRADAIVVMGASQWNGKPSPVFRARLDHALELYLSGFSDRIVLTGGVGAGEIISEAVSGRNYLSDKGVRSEHMFLEEKGRTSKESLDGTAKISTDKDIRSIILVSDGFHMMRIRKMTGDLGIISFVSPVKNSPINDDALTLFKFYIRESWVYVLYLVFGA